MKIDNEKLALYLAGELNENDKKTFEDEIDHNELKLLIKDLDYNDNLLNRMNENISANSDFMIKLNTRIDEYEQSQKSWYFILGNYFSDMLNIKSNVIPKFGMLSLLLIVSFTFYKINDNFSINTVDNDNNDIDLIANVPDEEAKADSLSINNESKFIYNNNKISK